MGEINSKKREDLGSAFNLFIKGMRLYVYKVITDVVGEEKWEEAFRSCLRRAQQDLWDSDIKNGIDAIDLIDFGHLKSFAISYKDALRDDFNRKANSAPTYFEDIADIRNKWAHHQPIQQEDSEQGFNRMIQVTRAIRMVELSDQIKDLKEKKEESKSKKTIDEVEAEDKSGLTPWFKNVSPHMDIQMGMLDESVFAANLAQVALNQAREIYLDREKFFSKTYFTAGLKTIAKRVINGLSEKTDAENRVISLETGFGGGKTHSLISLYHLAKWGSGANKSEYLKELIDYTGQIKFTSANVAVFTNTTNDPTQGRDVEGINIKTVWGELAYQLGGKKAYDIVKANDENRTAPKGLFQRVLEENGPALILIDELADYCVSASGVTVGNTSLADQTISFVQELSEAISNVQNCVLVATLPASVDEVASSQEGAQILTSLRNRLSRVSADTKPVADEEIFEVIRRRLFEDLGDAKEVKNVISKYMKYYEELSFNNEIPKKAAKSEYKALLQKSYPFHPELIDMFRIRWASNHDFQRTRGVLRLLASIVSDLWKRQGSLTGNNALIHTSDVNFVNLDALSSQLKKLYGNGYDAVITADVSGSSSNAFIIDNDKPEFKAYNIAQGVASTILLGSFGSSGANKGVSIEELKLCVLKPGTYNHNNINTALDSLEGMAHYLYYGSTGYSSKRYWFHTKPNVNILINSAKNEVKKQDIHAEIIQRIESKRQRINYFNVLVNPSDDIPEQKNPTLLILSPGYQATLDGVSGSVADKIKQIATKKGSGDRIYRNTILFLMCSENGYGKLYSDVSDYLSCLKIRDEYNSQLESDQKDDVKRRIEQANKQVESSLVSAYCIISKHTAQNGCESLVIRQFKDSIDSQVNFNLIDTIKGEEWYLESVGLGLLRRNNLLPGENTPIRTKDVYEAFIRYDDKPMISGISAIQDSLVRYCINGEFAIATGTENNWNNIYYKEVVPMFDVTDETYWIADKGLYKPKNEETTQKVEEAKKDLEKKEIPDVIEPDGDRKIKRIAIHGTVPLENYSSLFTSFINPLKDQGIEIEIKISAKSTPSKPMTENSVEYKIAKESAKQLGLNFDES